MAEAGNIEALSLTFTAGVAAGAFLSGLSGSYPAAALAFAATAFLAACALFDNRHPLPWILAAFLFCGLSCLLSSDLTGKAGASYFPEAASRLRALIDRIPFENERTSPLLKALLTGDRIGLQADLKALFRESGASHLLALSGLHIGILYLFFGKLTAPLGNSPSIRAARSAAVVLLSGVFTLMTGASPSLVRAFLFILINETLARSGRPRKGSRVLCLALLVQLAADPSSIRSIGFQLSYLAMAGFFLLYPRLEAWYPAGSRHTPFRRIWNAAALTLSCQVFTAPLVWMRFHTFPVHFLLTNLLAIPLTTVLMGCAAACTALSGAGCCPELLVRAVDLLCALLLQTLEIIRSM